jgi:hypothetical protein
MDGEGAGCHYAGWTEAAPGVALVEPAAGDDEASISDDDVEFEVGGLDDGSEVASDLLVDGDPLGAYSGDGSAVRWLQTHQVRAVQLVTSG